MDSSDPFAITISRQIGCGGGEIAHALATRLGFHLADREILEKAAAEFAVSREDLEPREEKLRSGWSPLLDYGAFAPDLFMPAAVPLAPIDFLPSTGEVFEVEASIIARLAAERSCVILGRCGFHVLREHPRHVAIALHADRGFRVRTVRERYGLAEAEARERIEENDRARSEYVHACTGRHASDARAFDLCLETSRIGIARCVDLIAAFVDARRAAAL